MSGRPTGPATPPHYAQPHYAQAAYPQPHYAQPAYPQPQYPQPLYPQSHYAQRGDVATQGGYPHVDGYPGQFGDHPGFGYPPAGGLPPGVRLASWFQRVGATLIDGLAIGGIVGVSTGVGLAFSDTAGLLLVLLGYLGSFVFGIWNLVRQGATGQTLGKSALNISLRREADGSYVGAGLSIGRGFLHILDAIPFYLGYLWPLWDAKRQTFADKVVHTVVIRG